MLKVTPKVLGTVSGTTYVGRTVAGGLGNRVDLDRGRVTLSQVCGFLIQIESGKPVAIKADRDVTADFGGKKISLARYRPTALR